MSTKIIRTSLIDAYLPQLVVKFGARNPVDTAILRALFAERRYAEMAGVIKNSMLLDCALRIGFVKNTGGPKKSPAWLDIPQPFPHYGSMAFKKMRITMHIRNSFLQSAPFSSVAYTMAHEMAHIVLASTYHPLQSCEEAVDLTAMTLGYVNIYIDGCLYSEKTGSPSVKCDMINFWTRIFTWRYKKLSDEFSSDRTPCKKYMLGYLSLEEITYAAKLLQAHRLA